jgi:hypothetical protein
MLLLLPWLVLLLLVAAGPEVAWGVLLVVGHLGAAAAAAAAAVALAAAAVVGSLAPVGFPCIKAFNAGSIMRHSIQLNVWADSGASSSVAGLPLNVGLHVTAPLLLLLLLLSADVALAHLASISTAAACTHSKCMCSPLHRRNLHKYTEGSLQSG